jgi:hypothetical protein
VRVAAESSVWLPVASRGWGSPARATPERRLSERTREFDQRSAVMAAPRLNREAGWQF